MTHWIISWTCYGQWLPGDSRGFVGSVVEDQGNRVNHNTPGTPHDADMPRLELWVRQQMKGDPVELGRPEAEAMVAQYQETARIKRWELEAASVMWDHTHLVVGIADETDPEHAASIFKTWATRAVKKLRPLPPNGAFWTANSSTRIVKGERSLRTRVVYVARKQRNPLATWWAPRWQEVLDGYDRIQQEEAQRAERRQPPGDTKPGP